MSRIPLSFYDIFGYIAPGFLILFVFDYFPFLEQRFIIGKDLTLISSVLWIGLAYALGHILEMPSSLISPNFPFFRIFAAPDVKLSVTRSSKLWHKFGSFTSLADPIREKIIEIAKENDILKANIEDILKANKKDIPKANKKDISKANAAIFQHAYAKVKLHEDLLNRTEIFLRLYAFCRNLSFSLLIATLIILYFIIFRNTGSIFLAILTSVSSIAMFLNFRRFYRIYYYDILLSYYGLKLK